MNIESIEPIAVSLPMIKPVIMAGEEVRRADNVLVRIAADDGLVGWGEAAAAPLMTGETLESIVSAVHYMAPGLRGRDAADIDGARAAMDARMYGNHGAKAAIEIALYDLAGLAAGKPVHALLGETKRARLPLLGVIGGGDFAGDLHDAEKKKAAGFTIFKIKVGIDTPEKDAARTRAICERLGPDMLISADANQGFGVEDALRYVRAVEGAGLAFFEQPVEAADLAGMARVQAATDIAIGADEGIHSLDDIRRHHAAKAARGVSLKAIKLGGLNALVEAGRLCADARHEGQRLLQDRRIERRLRCRAARGLRAARSRLGPDAHSRRARRRRERNAARHRARLCRMPEPSRARHSGRRGARAAPSGGHRRPQRGVTL